MRTLVVVFGLLLAPCTHAQGASPIVGTEPVVITTGMLDCSRWSTWVQGTPEVVVVPALDSETTRLLADLARLLNDIEKAPELAKKNTDSAEAALDKIQAAFGSRRLRTNYGTGSMDIPQRDRWDYYENLVTHCTLATLATTITQLERRVEGDLKDLEPQSKTTGTVAAQARNDISWLRSNMSRVIDQLKEIAKKNSVPSPVELARAEWQKFQSKELPVLERVIESKVIARSPIAKNGGFEVDGQGRVLACITIADRKLYFSPDASSGVRFFNLETRTKPSGALADSD